MKTVPEPPPVVLAFSAHDPGGAAGIQADIESINRNGGRCVSVITAVTAQNTTTFASILPQNTINFRKQTDLLLADITVAACKIGLIGSTLLITEIADVLTRLGRLPVVLDPVLHAGTGTELATDETVEAMLELLIPVATVLTPNLKEALRLTGKSNKESAAKYLLEQGCHSVLITGADQSSPAVINTLYVKEQDPVDFEWQRLPGTYHGSGCTLASAIAAQLARGKDVRTAVELAQEYTWHTLKHGYRIGKSQFHPDRNYPE